MSDVTLIILGTHHTSHSMWHWSHFSHLKRKRLYAERKCFSKIVTKRIWEQKKQNLNLKNWYVVEMNGCLYKRDVEWEMRRMKRSNREKDKIKDYTQCTLQLLAHNNHQIYMLPFPERFHDYWQGSRWNIYIFYWLASCTLWYAQDVFSGLAADIWTLITSCTAPRWSIPRTSSSFPVATSSKEKVRVINSSRKRKPNNHLPSFHHCTRTCLCEILQLLRISMTHSP